MIKGDRKILKICLMLNTNASDQFFWANTFSISPQHNRGSMAIIGANKKATVPPLLLKPHPNISLNIFN